MPKHITLQINEPCHEDWNLMSPSEQGRYCGMCQKSVVDFTNMTDTQLSNYFKLNTGNTCGRFYEDQLNHPITIPTKTIPWLRYFFTISLPAFLFSAKAIAQKKVVAEKVTAVSNKPKTDSVMNKFPGYVGGGYTIYDSTSYNDAQANRRTPHLCYWNKPTNFDTLKIENLKEVIVYGVSSSKHIRRTISGAIAIGINVKTIPKSNVNSLIKPKVKVQPTFTISPNPSTTNSLLNILFTKELSGVVVIEIFSANGQLLKKETKNLLTKAKSTTINTNDLAAGFYICSVTEIKTKVKMSNEFIVH
jgi:Secretion system C-terminal sorting domain